MEHPEAKSTAPPEPHDDPAPPPVEHDAWRRRPYTRDELPPQVRLRAQHEGKWVAWSADMETIVAPAEQLRDLDEKIGRVGIVGAFQDHINLPHRQCHRL